MASRNTSAWVPIEIDASVTGRAPQTSAIYEIAPRRAMTTLEVDQPRLMGTDVGGGTNLVEDTHDGDTVPMYAYQFNGKQTLDQAQSEDSLPDDVSAFTAEWLKSFHIAFDNASIGVSGARAAETNPATTFRPYNSIYKVVRTNDTGAGYTADTNWSATGSGGLTYANLNAALGKVEKTAFWTPSSGVIIMHPGLMDDIRGILDNGGKPIFVESTAGFPGGGVRPVYSLFGYPAYFTFGAQRSSNFKMPENGNPLVVFVNREYTRRGDRIPPQVRFIDAAINMNNLEHTLQERARQGFVLTVPQAASVLEVGVAS
jgi:hypothetical protein